MGDLEQDGSPPSGEEHYLAVEPPGRAVRSERAIRHHGVHIQPS
jgi:hypothetical protein